MKVAIVGGGPIGLAQALMLANQGHQVTLFERGTWPRDKACGQGIMPSGIKILKNLGIEFIPGKEGYAFKGIEYIDGPLSLSGSLPRAGIGVERLTLSRKLLEACHKRSEITLLDNTAVKDVIPKENTVIIKTEEDNQEFDFVFACDGVHSQVRKKLRNRKVRRGTWRMGAREHFNISPWTQKVEVYWQDGVEAYITPVSNEKIEVAFLWFEDALNPLDQSPLKDQLWRRFPELKKRCSPELSQGDFRGHGPFSTYAQEIQKGRVFFVGDAYCFLDGITGEGISLGLKGASLIAKNFQRWNWWHELRFKLHYWHYGLMVRLALGLSYNKRYRRLLFRMVQKAPKSFNIILKLNDF